MMGSALSCAECVAMADSNSSSDLFLCAVATARMASRPGPWWRRPALPLIRVVTCARGQSAGVVGGVGVEVGLLWLYLLGRVHHDLAQQHVLEAVDRLGVAHLGDARGGVEREVGREVE